MGAASILCQPNQINANKNSNASLDGQVIAELDRQRQNYHLNQLQKPFSDHHKMGPPESTNQLARQQHQQIRMLNDEKTQTFDTNVSPMSSGRVSKPVKFTYVDALTIKDSWDGEIDQTTITQATTLINIPKNLKYPNSDQKSQFDLVSKKKEEAEKISYNSIRQQGTDGKYILSQLPNKMKTEGIQSPRRRISQSVPLLQIKIKWDSFIKLKCLNFQNQYQVIRKIGKGAFGVVYKVKGKYSGILRAAKRINKATLRQIDAEQLFSEMAILTSLDHPYIAKLCEVFDFQGQYVLIMELCEGGQLYKRVLQNKFSQKAAICIFRQIVLALAYLHRCGVIHRDLKLENMLFEKGTQNLKIIDFGISIKHNQNDKRLTMRIGTPYYLAPEVLYKYYDYRCDIWSAGVILYMMLCGRPPFQGDTEDEIYTAIINKAPQLTGGVWNRISKQGRDIIQKMLEKDPQKRITPQEVLRHQWLSSQFEKSLAKDKLAKQYENSLKPTKTINSNEQVSNITHFRFKDRLQAVVYTYIVSQLISSADKQHLLSLFLQFDRNLDGVITSTEFQKCLQNYKSIPQSRINVLVNAIDTNSSGVIDYTEFLVAVIDYGSLDCENYFQKAFAYFDIDHSGVISYQEIAAYLESNSNDDDSIKRIFDQVDQNGDGEISKEQFVGLLMDRIKRMKDQIASNVSSKPNNIQAQSVL